MKSFCPCRSVGSEELPPDTTWASSQRAEGACSGDRDATWLVWEQGRERRKALHSRSHGGVVIYCRVSMATDAVSSK